MNAMRNESMNDEVYNREMNWINKWINESMNRWVSVWINRWIIDEMNKCWYWWHQTNATCPIQVYANRSLPSLHILMGVFCWGYSLLDHVALFVLMFFFSADYLYVESLLFTCLLLITIIILLMFVHWNCCIDNSHQQLQWMNVLNIYIYIF